MAQQLDITQNAATEMLKNVAGGKERVDTPEEWRQVQTSLTTIGVYKGPIDGKKASSHAALVEYQRKEELVRDGIVGRDTSAALLSDLKVPSSPSRAVDGGEPTNATAPKADKITLNPFSHDQLTQRRVVRGTTRQDLADDVVSSLKGQTGKLVQAGYLEASPEYKALLDRKAEFQRQKEEIAKNKEELKDTITELSRKRDKSRRYADVRYLNNIIRSKSKAIAGLDKQSDIIERNEDKLDRQMQKSELVMQKQLRSKVISALPTNLKAGAKVDVLDATGLDDIVERQAGRRGAGGSPAATIRQLRGHEYVTDAIAAAERHGVPPALFVGLIQAESKFDPNALSPKGAAGIAQFMPGTAARFGVDAYNPIQALDGSARYLKTLNKLFRGDWTLTVAAYNAGEGAVQSYGNQIPPYKETQNYVDRVFDNVDKIGSLPGGIAYLMPSETKAASPRARHRR